MASRNAREPPPWPQARARLPAERLEIPRRRPNLFAFNHQLINVPGSTVFIPIADMTRQCITAMLLYFDRPHGERWQMVDANGVESGLVVANLATATQALGLGGHPFSGGKGRVIMGGERSDHPAQICSLRTRCELLPRAPTGEAVQGFR